MSLETRITKLESLCATSSIDSAFLRSRDAEIMRCEMLLASLERRGDMERQMGLSQYLKELQAGLHDEQIAAELQRPPLTNDEHAREQRALLLEEVRARRARRAARNVAAD